MYDGDFGVDAECDDCSILSFEFQCLTAQVKHIQLQVTRLQSAMSQSLEL